MLDPKGGYTRGRDPAVTAVPVVVVGLQLASACGALRDLSHLAYVNEAQRSYAGVVGHW
jgi:hypothetical protein